MMLFITTLIIAAVIGFVSSSDSEWFCGIAGQAAHGLLSTVCFALVGVAFWRFGWVMGIIDLALILIASNASLGFCRYFKKRLVLSDSHRWLAQ